MSTEVQSEAAYAHKLEKNYTHNALIATAASGVFSLGNGMVNLGTILTYFISLFVSSNTLVGLLNTVWTLSYFLPTFFLSPHLNGLKKFKQDYQKNSLISLFFWLLIALSSYFLIGRFDGLFVVLFYAFYACATVFQGFAEHIFSLLTKKIIPENHLGKFLGFRFTTMGVMTFFGSLLVGALLSRIGFPRNYTLVFIVFIIFGCIARVITSRLREPKTINAPEKQTQKENLLVTKRILKDDHRFRMYLASTMIIILGKSAFTFQIIHAKEIIGITASQVAITTAVMFASQTLGFMVWGALNDRWGFKSTLSISAFLLTTGIGCLFLSRSIFMVYLTIFVFGFAQSARNVGEMQLVLSISAPGRAVNYAGIRNLCLSPFFSGSSVLCGLLIDNIGYAQSFIACAIVSLLGALVFTLTVKAPVRAESSPV